MAGKAPQAKLPTTPSRYDPRNEAAFRRAVTQMFQDALYINPQEWVTVSADAPTGTPRHGKGSWWARTGGTPELHVWDGDSWEQIV